MNLPNLKTPLSVDAYIEGELHSEVKHEYLAGEVYAMSGASAAHNIIAGNLFSALHRHLRGGSCRVFMSDMKVRIQHAREDYFYYPDVMVACQPNDNARYWREQPKLIVEVLSESTERIDLREKFFAYQTLPALEEYMLLAQDKREATVFRRSEGWAACIVNGDALLELTSVGLSVGLGEVYEGVEPE